MRKRILIPLLIAAALLLVGAGSAGGLLLKSSPVDEHASEEELSSSFREGETAGSDYRSALDKERLAAAEIKAEIGEELGYEEGYEAGEESGERFGAELATPERVNFYTRYMVVYEPSKHGPELRGWLEMPLGTTWRCQDLEGCTELAE